MRIVFVVFLLLLTFTGSVLAQADMVYCGELAEADCQILTESAEVMGNLESAVFHLDLNMSFDDTSTEGDAFGLRLYGDGTFAIDPAQAEILNYSPGDWLENMDALPELVESAIRSISTDMSIIIEAQDTMFGENADPSYVALDLILADGFGYINLDKLMGEDDFGYMPSGWQGLDIAQLYRLALENQMDMMGDAFTDSALDLSAWNSMPYMQVERLDDQEIAGQSVAVFQNTLDIAGYFDTPEVRDMFHEALRDSLDLPDFDVDPDTLLDAYVELFTDMDVQITQAIGLEDHYVYQFGMSIVWTPKISTFAEALNEPLLPSEEDMAYEMILDLTVDLSQFGDAPLAVAPEDATIIPLNMLLPYMFPDIIDRA